jgi:hypothetical protein
MNSKARKPQRSPARPKATSKPKVRKSAVVIAGMHRSGTSVVARTLSLLGCSLPQTLIQPSRNNERGYWESRAVVNINDEILASAGSSWDDWEPVNGAWFRSPVAADFRSRAQDVLASEFGTSRLFVLKDPRISRLLPFWTEVLDGFGATPLIVCPLRNPLEVATSLEARNQLDPSIGHLLWLRHVLDAEVASRGLKRAYVRYDDLVECWQDVVDRLSDSLGVGWPRRSRTADQEIQQFLDQALRHHVRKDSSVLRNSSLSQWIRSSFEILDRWTKDDVRDTDRSELDRIKSDFDSAAIAFRHPVAVGREAAQASRSWEATATELQGTLERQQADVGELTARLEACDARIGELGKDIQARDAKIGELGKDIQARDAKVGELRKQIQDTAADLAAAQETLRVMTKAAAENHKVMTGQKELVEMMSAALLAKRTAYAALETAILAKS